MTRSARPFLWLLLAAALLMRAFVPQGYMAERSETGTIAVALCGSGEVHLIKLADRTCPQDDGQRAEPPCAFAGLGAPALPPSLGAEMSPPDIAQTLFTGNSFAAPGPAAPRLGPPATGPPLLA